MNVRGRGRPVLFAVALAAAVFAPAARATGTSAPDMQPAVAGSAFVDSIGVDVHLHYTDGPYVQSWPRVEAALRELGVRHVRDGLIDTTWKPYYQHIDALWADGIGTTLTSSAGQNAALFSSYLTRVKHVDMFEGVNEPKVRDAASLVPIESVQRDLWSVARTDGRSIPVAGPSFITPDSFALAKGFGSIETYGNIHPYPGGRNPGTPGWGDAGFGSNYGSLAWNVGSARQSSGSRPIVITETGYFTQPGTGPQAIPRDIAARYEPRLFLESWRAGIVRTFQYELLDEGGGETADFGLLDSSLNPKPSFVALQSLIREVRCDKCSPAKPVAVRIEDAPPSVHFLLFSKGPNAYSLALWQEVQSYDTAAKTVSPVSPARVAIRFGSPVSRTVVRRFDDRGSLERLAGPANATLMNESIDDRVTFIDFDTSEHSQS